MTTDELRELLLAYDAYEGAYPENQFEGMSVWQFICGKLNIPDGLPEWNSFEDDNVTDAWKAQMKHDT